jgi:hypothetical protein
MPLDVKQFATDLGLSPEDQQALFSLFEKNPGVTEKLTGLVNTQVEAALAPAKADLAKKTKYLEDQWATIDKVRGGDAATLEAANRSVERPPPP